MHGLDSPIPNTIDDFWKPDTQTPLGKALTQRCPTFQRLDRMIDTNERRFRQATAELERLQADRRAQEKAAAAQRPPEHEPAPPPKPVQSETTPHEIGFVPSTSDPNPSPIVPEVASGGKIGFFSTRKGGRR